MRGRSGKSLRAPTLTESNPQAFSLLTSVNAVNGAGDPANPITVAGVRQPISTVPSWTTIDAGFAYAIPNSEGGWLSGTRLSVSAQNVTDRDPPIVLTGVNATDNLVHNPYGRIGTLELSKRF